MILLHLLVYQKKIINSNENENENLLLIKLIFNFFSNKCEYYFNNNKYMDENNVLFIINKILIYITRTVIGYNLESTIKNLLYQYFYNNNTFRNKNEKTNYSNKKINYIFHNNIEYNINLVNYIYDIVCPSLVTSSVGIFANKNEELQYEKLQIKDILKNLVDLLDNSPIFIDETFKNSLKKKIILYFDTFVSNIILLWYVNIENILKFIINNYRSLEILTILTN